MCYCYVCYNIKLNLFYDLLALIFFNSCKMQPGSRIKDQGDATMKRTQKRFNQTIIIQRTFFSHFSFRYIQRIRHGLILSFCIDQHVQYPLQSFNVHPIGHLQNLMQRLPHDTVLQSRMSNEALGGRETQSRM